MRGFVCGTFDLLHPGHLHLLSECKLRCNYLIVGLQVNPNRERKKKNRPIQSIWERYVQLKANRWVDEIVPYETEEDLTNILKIYGIDKRFLGSEYIDCPDKITGREIVHITFIDRTHSYSSTELRSRI